ncbi:MAG: FAD-binding protein [Nannocystaceae bacterium]
MRSPAECVDYLRYAAAAASVAPRTLWSAARGRLEPEIPEGWDFGRMRHQHYTVVEVDGPEALARALAAAYAARTPVAMGGSRHSANGQTLPRRTGIQLRARRDGAGWAAPTMIDEEHVRVAGVHTWRTLQDFLRARGRTCTVLTDHLTTSIAGTLSVGGGIGTRSVAFGRQLDAVRSFGLILPSGDRVRCSPTENAGLFRHAMGGMGELGVLDEITLWTRPYVSWLAIHRYQARTLVEAMSLVHHVLYHPEAPENLTHLVVEGPILGTPFIQFEIGFELADRAEARASLRRPPACLEAVEPHRRAAFDRALAPADHANDRHNRSSVYIASLVHHKHLWNDYFFADFDAYLRFLEIAQRRILAERGHDRLLSGLAFAYPGDPLDPVDPARRRAAFSYPARVGERYRWSFGFNFSVPDGPEVAQVADTLDALRRAATELGAGVYGYGYDRRGPEDFRRAYGPIVDDFLALKAAVDPHGLFGAGLPLEARADRDRSAAAISGAGPRGRRASIDGSVEEPGEDAVEREDPDQPGRQPEDVTARRRQHQRARPGAGGLRLRVAAHRRQAPERVDDQEGEEAGDRRPPRRVAIQQRAEAVGDRRRDRGDQELDEGVVVEDDHAGRP